MFSTFEESVKMDCHVSDSLFSMSEIRYSVKYSYEDNQDNYSSIKYGPKKATLRSCLCMNLRLMK